MSEDFKSHTFFGFEYFVKGSWREWVRAILISIKCDRNVASKNKEFHANWVFGGTGKMYDN